MILTEFLLYFTSQMLPHERLAPSHPDQDPRLSTEPGMEAGGEAGRKASGLTVPGGSRRARTPGCTLLPVLWHIHALLPG